MGCVVTPKGGILCCEVLVVSCSDDVQKQSIQIAKAKQVKGNNFLFFLFWGGMEREVRKKQ